MQGMSEVTDEGGTAGSVFADYPIKVGGKTGTAEMFENGESFGQRSVHRVCALDNPQIVICVVGEGAGHGAYVAPIVRDMLDEYFSVGKVGPRSLPSGGEHPDSIKTIVSETAVSRAA